jgi:AcrR family transcriptional regulator
VTEVTQARRYRGLSADERRRERRQRLMDAAFELFGTAGYDRTSIERLCSSSGVTARHFYQEFASRDALLCAVGDQITESVLSAVTEAVAAAPDTPHERAHAGLSAMLKGVLGDRRVARILLIESPSSGRDVGVRRRVLRSFAAIIESECRRLYAAGQVKERDFLLTSTAMVGATVELLVEWFAGRLEVSLAELADEITRIYIAVGEHD